MVSFHTKMLHKEKNPQTYFKTKNSQDKLIFCHGLSWLQGVGRGISSGIERSRAGGSKHNPRYNSRGRRREGNQDKLLGLSFNINKSQPKITSGYLS